MSTYQNNIEKFHTKRTVLKKRASLIGWGRFLSLAVAIWIFIAFWPDFTWYAILGILVFFGLFLYLVSLALANRSTLIFTEHLMAINQEELDIASGKFYERFDGIEFQPSVHEYAYDLDILGRASLYQYTHRCESHAGRKQYAWWLLNHAHAAEIKDRQEAANFLVMESDWRQSFQATNRINPLGSDLERRLLSGQHGEGTDFGKPYWRMLQWAGPIVSCSFLLLYIFDKISLPAFNAYLLVFFIITGYISKLATPAYRQLEKMAAEVNGLSQSLFCLEQMNDGEIAWLRERKNRLFSGNGIPSSIAIRQLNQILKRLDYRLNPLVFIPLNILLFWDLQQMTVLRKWKQIHSASLNGWLAVLGEMEAVSSLAALKFNHPDWCFPQINSDKGCLEFTRLGHPLIRENKRVCSDFQSIGIPQVTIVTGSNMAGKSTFLRSVGLAMVMAQAGSPVCASKAAMSVLKVISSMRIADNLEESTSTFYAELKKLKSMIDAVNKGDEVYLLIDEMLRGTNSIDRNKGSKAFITQIIQKKGLGMVATHDLELADMEMSHTGSIQNFHFDVQVEGEELYFDYALKPGVCTSMNASLLMKKIGIEL